MACMLPSSALTPAEHECCRRMAKQCGSMRMAASHSCCRTEVRPSHAYLKTAVAVVGHDAVAIAPAEIFEPLSLALLLQNVAPSFVEHPPPEITLSTIVLKI